jgi:adenine-specific DNA-methyltransferase
MMCPRLSLLRQFLRKDGVIFVSIDDNELANLLYLMEEVFGPQNHLATIV